VSRWDESPRADLGLAMAAGLMGAAGVALSAIAAHRVQSPALVTAANFLVLHAAGVLALAAWSLQSPKAAGWWRVAARVMLSGVAVFAGDIAAREIGGFKLFAFAAPMGGSLMIGGWVLVAIAALVTWRRL
jgi:uncharacterized membrane protein YgdD (TMEM256/DUF423 family)